MKVLTLSSIKKQFLKYMVSIWQIVLLIKLWIGYFLGNISKYVFFCYSTLVGKKVVTNRFLFPLIFNKLNIDIASDSSELIYVISNIFVLCLLLFFSFLNIVKDLGILSLYNKYESLGTGNHIESKYPFFKKYKLSRRILKYMLNRYKKLTYLFIIYEVIFILILLVFLLGFCGLKLYNFVQVTA